LTTPTAIHRRPKFFWDLERHNQRQELSARFLDVRGRLLAKANEKRDGREKHKSGTVERQTKQT